MPRQPSSFLEIGLQPQSQSCPPVSGDHKPWGLCHCYSSSQQLLTFLEPVTVCFHVESHWVLHQLSQDGDQGHCWWMDWGSKIPRDLPQSHSQEHHPRLKADTQFWCLAPFLSHCPELIASGVTVWQYELCMSRYLPEGPVTLLEDTTGPADNMRTAPDEVHYSLDRKSARWTKMRRQFSLYTPGLQKMTRGP